MQNQFDSYEAAKAYAKSLPGYVCIGRLNGVFHVLRSPRLPVWFQHFYTAYHSDREAEIGSAMLDGAKAAKCVSKPVHR